MNQTLRIVAVLLLSLSFTQTWAVDSWPIPIQGEKAVVDSKTGFKSADDVFAFRALSQPWASGIINRFTGGEDPEHFAAHVRQKVLNVFNRQGQFRFLPILDYKNSEIYITSMNLGDPNITELIRELVKLGVGKIVVTVDGASAYEMRSGVKKKRTHVASDLKPRDSEVGAVMKELDKMGFVLSPQNADERLQIVINGVPKAKGVRDLMHKKGVVMKLVQEKKPGMFKGVFEKVRIGQVLGSPYEAIFNKETGEGYFEILKTENFTERKLKEDKTPADLVVNQLVDIVLPQLAQEDFENAKALAEALRTTGDITEVKAPDQGKVFTFEDGSMVVNAFTNGRNDVNKRMIDLEQHFINHSADLILTKITDGQFVLSYDPGLESLRTTLTKFPQAQYFGVFDNAFLNPAASGMVGVFGGIPARGDERIHEPFSSELRARMKVYGYRRVIENDEQAKEALRGKAMYHLKTRIYQFTRGAETWAVIFWGSMNLSGRFANAEWQQMILVKADSQIAQFFIQSIESGPKVRPQMHMELEPAVFATVIGSFLGVPPTDFYISELRQLLSSLAKNNFDSFNSLAEEIYSRSEKKTKTIRNSDGQYVETVLVDRKELKARLNILEKIFGWYNDNVVAELRGYNLTTGVSGFFADMFTGTVDRLRDQVESGRAMMTPGQLASVLTTISIDRSLKNRMAKAEGEEEESEQELDRFSRQRMVEALRAPGLPEGKQHELALKLNNMIRQLCGLEPDTEADFKSGLEPVSCESTTAGKTKTRKAK